jgi:hypothetical protein
LSCLPLTGLALVLSSPTLRFLSGEPAPAPPRPPWAFH